MKTLLLLLLFPFVPILCVASVNTLVIGETQKGKSTLVINEDTIPTIQSRSCAVFVFDPHDSFAEKIARFCATMGHSKRLVVDNLGSTDFVASPGIIERSRAATAIQRGFENDATAKDFMYALAMDRKESINTQPMNRKYTLLAVRAWLHNRNDLPLWYLPWALKPGTPFFDKILEGVEDAEARYDIAFLKGLSPTKLMEHVGGAERLLSEKFGERPFKYRMVPTFDLKTFIESKGIFCLSGGIADDATKTMMMRLLHLRIIAMVKNHYATTKRPLPVKVYVDEAANFRLYGLPESRALAETTKMGKTDTLIVQVPSFGDPDIDFNVFQNTPRKIILKSSPPVSETAAKLLKANLDPYKEHHRDTTTRQRHAGFRVEERTSKSSNAHGAGRTVSEAHVPIYEDVQEERVHYMALNDQTLMNEVAVEQLRRGECFITDGTTVLKHKFKDWEDPGVFQGDPDRGIKSYSEQKLDLHIAWLRQMGVLRPPAEIEYEACIHTSKETSRTPEKPPAPPTTKRPGKGMKRS